MTDCKSTAPDRAPEGLQFFCFTERGMAADELKKLNRRELPELPIGEMRENDRREAKEFLIITGEKTE